MNETNNLSRALTRPVPLHTAEWVAIGYFCYTLALCLSRGAGVARVAAAASVPVFIWILAVTESASSRPWSRVCRALMPSGLILAAYWQVEWFPAAPLENLEQTWVGWDRLVLKEWGLHNALEALGAVIPLVLDTAYFLLYAIPPLCVLILISTGRGDRLDAFLTTLLMGTFLAYALLPHFPTLAPRHAFPGELLPSFLSPVRRLNLFVLDHMDISTSVFPSGHVAVAFSSALGMLRALPELRWPAIGLGIYAILVFTATIYGRYHYAADGLASIALSLCAWRLTRR